MKITVFTSNQSRHLNLINELSKVADKVYTVLECNTVYPGLKKDFFSNSDIFKEYFNNVLKAQNKFFGAPSFLKGNINSFSIKSGDLNHLNQNELAEALDSDLYIVFGASYIRGWLIDFLTSKKAINIHMGVSPYYRGSSCNFWASYNSDFHLVGSTIHYLSKGLDSGNMIAHALPTVKQCDNPFDFTMKSVVAAQQCLIELISDEQLFEIKQQVQNKELEISYTRNADFTDEVAKDFMDRKVNIDQISEKLKINRKNFNYLNPYFY